MRVEYYANNSGGQWWLTDEDWFKLEKNGWVVEWIKNQKDDIFLIGKNERFLGALACNAWIDGLSLKNAVNNWESALGRTVEGDGPGCPCCGCPHYFEEYDDDGRLVKSYEAGGNLND